MSGRMPFFRRILERFRRPAPAKSRQDARARVGRRGERLAVRYLEGLGYRIVATNVRLPLGHAPSGKAIVGEIDIVAYDGDILVFVEVKTRRREGIYPIQSVVDARKRSLLARSAKRYRRILGVLADPYRFDVVTVSLERADAPHVRVYRNYFAPGQKRESE